MCHWGPDVESVSQFLLYCPMCTTKTQIPLSALLENANPTLTNILVSGDASFNRASNTQMLNTAIEHSLSTKSYKEPLFKFCRNFLTSH